MKRDRTILCGAAILCLLSTNFVSAQSRQIKLVKGRKLILKGSVYEGDERNYTFRAKEGQQLTVKLISKDAVFNLYGGAVYAEQFCDEKQFWSGKLPFGDADDEYLIKLLSNYKSASYTLEIVLK